MYRSGQMFVLLLAKTSVRLSGKFIIKRNICRNRVSEKNVVYFWKQITGYVTGKLVTLILNIQPFKIKLSSGDFCGDVTDVTAELNSLNLTCATRSMRPAVIPSSSRSTDRMRPGRSRIGKALWGTSNHKRRALNAAQMIADDPDKPACLGIVVS